MEESLNTLESKCVLYLENQNMKNSDSNYVKKILLYQQAKDEIEEYKKSIPFVPVMTIAGLVTCAFMNYFAFSSNREGSDLLENVVVGVSSFAAPFFSYVLYNTITKKRDAKKYFNQAKELK